MSKDDRLREADYAFSVAQHGIYIQQALIFNLLRILKKINPGDTYYENYVGHFQRIPRLPVENWL